VIELQAGAKQFLRCTHEPEKLQFDLGAVGRWIYLRILVNQCTILAVEGLLEHSTNLSNATIDCITSVLQTLDFLVCHCR